MSASSIISDCSSPTVEQFILNCKSTKSRITKSLWCQWQDHTVVYLRVSRKLINNKIVDTVDIANIQTEPQARGKGSFWALVSYLQNQYPYRFIFVENVFNEKLEASLDLRAKRLYAHGIAVVPPCFYFEPLV